MDHCHHHVDYFLEKYDIFENKVQMNEVQMEKAKENGFNENLVHNSRKLIYPGLDDLDAAVKWVQLKKADGRICERYFVNQYSEILGREGDIMAAGNQRGYITLRGKDSDGNELGNVNVYRSCAFAFLENPGGDLSTFHVDHIVALGKNCTECGVGIRCEDRRHKNNHISNLQFLSRPLHTIKTKIESPAGDQLSLANGYRVKIIKRAEGEEFEVGTVFDSANKAGIATGLSSAVVSNSCLRKQMVPRSAKRYQFEYLGDPDLPGEKWRHVKDLKNQEVIDEYDGRIRSVSNMGRVIGVRGKKSAGSVRGHYSRVNVKDKSSHVNIHLIIYEIWHDCKVDDNFSLSFNSDITGIPKEVRQVNGVERSYIGDFCLEKKSEKTKSNRKSLKRKRKAN